MWHLVYWTKRTCLEKTGICFLFGLGIWVTTATLQSFLPIGKQGGTAEGRKEQRQEQKQKAETTISRR